MFNVFNMGVGMTVIVDSNDVAAALKALEAAGEHPYVMGKVIEDSDSSIVIE